MGLHDEAGTHRRGGTMCPTSVGNLPRSRGGGCQLLFLFAGPRSTAPAPQPAMLHFDFDDGPPPTCLTTPISQPLGPITTPPNIPTPASALTPISRSEEHTSELQSQSNLVCRLLLE